jgi:hypothetical protein
MSTPSSKHLESIFYAALEKPAAERGAYLAAACGDDAALRNRLELMLAAQDGSRWPNLDPEKLATHFYATGAPALVGPCCPVGWILA